MAWSKVSRKIKNGKKREPFSELVVRTVSKRIDLNQFEELIESIVICEEEYIKGQDSLLEDCQTLKDKMQIALAELKKMYAREARLLEALRIIRDDLDEVTSSPINEVEKDKLLKKIRNFANDASQ